ITVPAYATNTADDHRHVLNDSGASAAIISTPALAKRFRPAFDAAEACKTLFAMEPVDGAETMADAIAAGGDADIDATVAGLTRGDMACIIYTSGTGGAPKGVMTNHGAILLNCVGAYELLEGFGFEETERFLSFLPLSHSYEHTAGLWFPISIAASIAYAESIDKLVANMAEIQPTVMTAVPRLYESMRDRIQRGLKQQPKLRQRLFAKTLELGAKRYQTPKAMGVVDKALDAALDKLVRRKVAQRFGGALKGFVSGGGRLDPEVGLFFTALGVRLLQGYGQTETGPVVSCNKADSVKIETVGPIFPEVEVKIAEDGEILVKGELVMRGYWKNGDATAQAFDADGWLKTGDIGAFDDAGRLMITDRKKDILVMSGGDNVSPARIEGKLALRPEIAQAVALGDGESHVAALIVVDSAWAADNGFAKAGPEDQDLRKAVGAAVDAINRDLSVIEKVKRFALLAEPCTIDNGLMTPTMKIKRHKLKERYGDEIRGLFKKAA
ncbi:MAG: AMP-binding protein, partial [Pseudomonadota bacterium]